MSERRPIPPHIIALLVREIDRMLEVEGEMFKPGRMHHNGPRRISVEIEVHNAKLLRDWLTQQADDLRAHRTGNSAGALATDTETPT